MEDAHIGSLLFSTWAAFSTLLADELPVTIAAGQLGEESDLDSDREKRNKGRKRARKSVAKQQKPKINYLLEIPLDSFIVSQFLDSSYFVDTFIEMYL